MSKEIKVTCKGADILPIDALENFQGNLKKNELKAIISASQNPFKFFIEGETVE